MASKLFLKTLNMENRRFNKREMCGFHGTVRGTLLCSRVMGLLPLSGLTCPTSHKLRFTLRSPYTMFYAISLFGQVLMFIMTFCWVVLNGISLANMTNSIFNTSSLVSVLILMHIGRCWPALVAKVESIECKLPPFTRNVGVMSNITTIFIFTAAVVEHLLSVYYGLKVACACDINNVGETYFRFSMPWIFDYTPYAAWKGALIEIFNIQSTFVWSYNDLLIMIISIYLTEHLLVHNELLKKAVEQEHFPCQVFRSQYLKIVHLVRLINGQFGIYILTSFGSNLYWICTQLFYSLSRTQTGHFIACSFKEPEGANAVHMFENHPICSWMLDDRRALNGLEHSIYFTYSFSFLLVRTLMVLLLAARIHSNSIAPLYVLYGIPSSRFHVEVERFIAQINNLKVAMSGLDFFYVTRTMILTLLGTIVTYELVLLQFNR
ncbi:gustatory receptor 5a for trehalose-like [Spodoptera litura]|uniref:Gustatory receptor n=1 Tax=Spodoptera litura TaxID=69820 RepID=A0A9J7DYP2_SPOLT|nr:gustatory receptor 5a for trehalose-like [Spodoptera litura]